MAKLKPATPVPLPLKGLPWADLIGPIGKARASLADYNGMLRHLPNAAMLLAPLTFQEAVLSSRIEGTLATMTEVLQFEAGELPLQEARRLDIEEILNYRKALALAMERLGPRPFNLNLLLELHKVLLQGVRGQNKARGEFRKQQNYIGSVSGGVETIRFTPPSWEQLENALGNWERYYHSEERDPIVQLAIIHAQFEYLHPFLDGNGRLGRILVPIFLFEKGLLREPNFYLSEYIEAHRDEYVDLLNRLDSSGATWAAWIRFFLVAVDKQAQANATKTSAMLAHYEELKIRFPTETKSRFAIPLLDSVFRRPVFQTGQIVWSGDRPSQPTLTNMLNTLRDAGLLALVRVGRGQMPSIWALESLIAIAEQRPQPPHPTTHEPSR